MFLPKCCLKMYNFKDFSYLFQKSSSLFLIINAWQIKSKNEALCLTRFSKIGLPFLCLNPIPAKVLENQDMLDMLNPMFDVQIWQMIHHWKALVLYFENLQINLQIWKNCNFFCKIQLYSKNACKKKNCAKNEKLYIF